MKIVFLVDGIGHRFIDVFSHRHSRSCWPCKSRWGVILVKRFSTNVWCVVQLPPISWRFEVGKFTGLYKLTDGPCPSFPVFRSFRLCGLCYIFGHFGAFSSGRSISFISAKLYFLFYFFPLGKEPERPHQKLHIVRFAFWFLVGFSTVFSVYYLYLEKFGLKDQKLIVVTKMYSRIELSTLAGHKKLW